MRLIPRFLGGGLSQYTGVQRAADKDNWYKYQFLPARDTILNNLSLDSDDFGYWLNDLLSHHAIINDLNKNWKESNVSKYNEKVKNYQDAFSGINNGELTYDSGLDKMIDWNQLGIENSFKNGVFLTPGTRISMDRPGHYKSDGLYSGITDWRYLLGRKGDWDETSEEWKQWLEALGKKGWMSYLDKDGYYKLRRLPSPNTPPSDTDSDKLLMPQFILEGLDKLNDRLNNYKVPLGRSGAVEAEKYQKSPSQWTGFWDNLKGLVPNILEATRLAGSLIANQRIYDASKKGVRPNLKQPFLTGRQVFGDEASKQGYYTRAALINTKANQPITSDMSLQLALQYEANKLANELKALGDLIDNLRIKETSAEASLHADANILRRTEVANFNTEQFNAANAALLNLLAQKRAADWTSIDNALKGVEYRWRLKKAENDSILRQISLLDYENDIATDKGLQNLLKNYREALAKTAKTNLYGMTVYDYSDPDVSDARAALDSYKRQKQRDYLRSQLNGPVFAEKGTKITYKKKDDLLYKSAKDAVEHFRKMTKLTDDSYHKSRRHKFKFSTKKLQQGGVAPFTVFTPVALGGETTTTVSGGGQTAASGNGRASKSDSTKDLMDMLKSLFSKLDGLPSDVGAAYVPIQMLLQQVEMEGSEMSTLEIATAYMLAMQQILKINYSKKLTDEARKNVTDNDALHEVAIAPDGSVFVQSRKDGKIKTMDFKEAALSDDFTVLSNDQLLLLREYVFPFMDNLLPSLNGAVGINKVMELVKKLAGNLGTDEIQLQGFSKKEADSIAKGLELLQNPKLAAVLLSNTPEGEYEYTETIKNQRLQMNSALNFIFMSLPNNMKNVLQVYADKSGVKPVDIVIQGLNSQISSTYKIDWNPVTGKAASSKNSNGDGSDSSKATFNDMVQRGLIGIPREFSIITKDGQTKFYSSDSRYVSQLPEVSSDTSITLMLSESKIGEILDSRLGITFGDLVINSENLKDIMFSVGGGATFVTLPCKYENGHKVVNFAIKDEFDDAIKEASKTIPIDWTDDNFKKKLAEILKLKGLDNLLTSSMDIDPNMLGLFLVVEGYTTDRVNFNKNSRYIEKINNPDKELENRLNEALSTKGLDGKVQKYDVDINDWNLGFLFEGGWDDIYHANVFIPLNNDPLSAQIGNDTFKRDDARNLMREKLNYLKLVTAKSTNSNLL